MSVLGKLKSIFGFNEEDTNEISSFDNAGMTPDGTMGTDTVDVVSQNQTLPDDVVNNPPPTNTGTQTGVGTPPPAFSTPGINPYMDVNFNQMVTSVDDKGKKSQALQDIITLGGTQFDDDVLARKLRRQAAMPELKNEDYYPNEPFTQGQTAWGDPVYSGAGALFPMAAYDAQRKARAQAELDEVAQQTMQIKIPEINTGAYAERFKTGFIDEVSNLTNDYVKKYGNSKKAIQAMRQDGSLGKLQAKFEGVAKSIDQTAGRASEFLKGAQEKASTMYYSPEGVRAATNFMNGMDAYSKGLITPEQLNQLEQQFNTAERWENYKERNMKLLKPSDYIPTQQQLDNVSQEDLAGYESLRLKGAAPDFKKWIFEQKYSEAALPQVMSGIVEPFFSENSMAAEQLVRPGEKLEDAKLRVAQGIVDMYGRQVVAGEATQNPRGKGISIKAGGGKQPKKTFYKSINERMPDIREQISSISPSNEAEAKQNAEQIFGGGTADDLIFGIRAFDWPTINQSISSMPYNELYEPNASDFNTRQEVFFGKVNKSNAGIASEDTTAKNLKVQGVINGFAVKGKDGQYRVFSNKDAVNSPLTADYKPYLIQVVTDQRYEDGSDVDAMDFMTLMKNKTKAPKSGIFFRFIPFDNSTATTFDKVADQSSTGTDGTESVEVEGEVVEDFD